MRTALAVQQGLAGVHTLGMGLDLFFDRHDSDRVFGGGARRGIPTLRRPLFHSSPKQTTTCRGAQKEGRGPNCLIPGGGVARGGAA